MALAESLISLPGPVRFIRDVADDVEAGRSIAIVFPDEAVIDGSADSVLREIARLTRADECPPPDSPDHSVPRLLVDLFGDDGSWAPSMDPWRDLLEWRGLRGERAVLRSWDHDVGHAALRWPALLMESGLGLAERPALIFAFRRRDVDESRLARLDALFISIHWWWGVMDRIDTETHLVLQRRRGGFDLLTLATVVEVAAWDLRLADSLVQHWDCRLDTLEKYVREHGVCRMAERANVVGDSGIARGTHKYSRASQPSRDDLELWDAGMVEKWDSVARPVQWWPKTAENLDNLVWRAQNRVLMPHVDRVRAYLEKKFRARASQEFLDGLLEQGDTLELGPMRWAVVQCGVRLDREDRGCLEILWKLRNLLAHGRPAADELIAVAKPYLGLR